MRFRLQDLSFWHIHEPPPWKTSLPAKAMMTATPPPVDSGLSCSSFLSKNIAFLLCVVERRFASVVLEDRVSKWRWSLWLSSIVAPFRSYSMCIFSSIWALGGIGQKLDIEGNLPHSILVWWPSQHHSSPDLSRCMQSMSLRSREKEQDGYKKNSSQNHQSERAGLKPNKKTNDAFWIDYAVPNRPAAELQNEWHKQTEERKGKENGKTQNESDWKRRK